MCPRGTCPQCKGRSPWPRREEERRRPGRPERPREERASQTPKAPLWQRGRVAPVRSAPSMLLGGTCARVAPVSTLEARLRRAPSQGPSVKKSCVGDCWSHGGPYAFLLFSFVSLLFSWTGPPGPSGRLQAVSGRGRHDQGGGGQSARLFAMCLILDLLLVGVFFLFLHTVTRKWTK